MGLVLFILKIILIAFVVVLGLILLLLGLILLVPIRYEVTGNIGDSWEIQVKGKVTYLLSMIKLLFTYEKEQFDMKVFIFGFQKKISEENISETSTIDRNKKNLEQEDSDKKERSFEEQEVSMEKELEEVTEFHNEATANKTGAPVSISEGKDESETDTSKQDRIKLKKKKKQKVKKQRSEDQKSKFDFAFIKQELTDEHNKSVVKKIFYELLYLLQHFKFRRIITDLRFSTGDPALTGQVLGILCMIPVLYRYDFKIVPDFEEEEAYMKGTFLVNGKVRLIHILITGLRLIFDKEVRLVVKKISTLLEN